MTQHNTWNVDGYSDNENNLLLHNLLLTNR